MSALPPRAVLVTRPSDLDALMARHSTRGQAEFFLTSRGQSLEPLVERHASQLRSCGEVRAAIPEGWRMAGVGRDNLPRFLFAEGDIVIAIGQDGLIANLAKYAHGRPILGVNPEPDRIAGVLAQFAPGDVGRVLGRVEAGDYECEHRAMVEVALERGQRLLALNEIFIGHHSHQSARYTIRSGAISEHQSSSGVIIASGTGLSGWARSIVEATGSQVSLTPDQRRLAYFSREPWPSPTTGTQLRQGYLDSGQHLELVSEMNEGGVIFADGIEADRIAFDWGLGAKIRIAPETLDLVKPG